MLKVYYSDRVEILAARLAERLRESRASPLQTYWVGVRNTGMADWLRRWIALQDTCVVNLECVDVHTWGRRVCELLLPDLSGPLPWERRYLSWRILAAFEEMADLDGPWRSLDNSARYRLAWQVARCFVSYQCESPDWLAGWGRGEGDHWQAHLWRHLGLSDELDALLQRLGQASGAETGSVYWLGVGFPHLPPPLLRALATRIDLHVMVWMPGGAVADPHVKGNVLRRSALALEQRQHGQLQSLADQVVDCHSEEPPGTSLLTMLQGDILADRFRGAGGAEPRPVDNKDRSLQVHICHSPMREVEVLYDQLLGLLQADTQLQPADIQVLIPAGQGYGPLVDAVFGAAEGDRYIPFRVTGEEHITGLAGVFIALLRLPAEDFATGPVLAILENEVVRRRFGLGLDDLPVIQRWVVVPEVRQALAAKGDIEAPDWRCRLASLMLGYVLGEGSHLPVAGILPDPLVNEAEAAMLGRLQSFVATLDWLRDLLDAEALPVNHWHERLVQVLERFFEPTPTDRSSVLGLRRVLLAIRRDAVEAAFEGAVSLMVLLDHLGVLLRDRAVTRPEPGAGVSFTTTRAALGTPAPVVCVLGAGGPSALMSNCGNLNLLTAARPLWNSQQAHAWFLQALLAARKVFYVSYVGRSIHDNRRLPVTSPVARLLDCVATGFWAEGGGELSSRLCSEHALMSVSRRYFLRADPLFSYAEELCAVSRILGQGSGEPGSLVEHPLTSPGVVWNALELERLALFLEHPTRFLLRERLGLDLEDYRPDGAARSGALSALSLAPVLLEIRLCGSEPTDLGLAFRAAGLLPPGQLGEAALRRSRQQVDTFVGRLREALEDTVLNPLELDIMVGSTRLVGRLRGVSSRGLLAFGAGAPSAADYLHLWLNHLTLNLLAPPGVTPVSTWMDPSGGFSLQPVIDPLAILDSLVDCYREGLCRPLHLFPASALAFARANLDEGGGLAEQAARRAWEGYSGVPGEEQDPYIRLAFRGEEPLEEEFARLAMRVFAPLLERCRELSG